jgi:hypothetical protein
MPRDTSDVNRALQSYYRDITTAPLPPRMVQLLSLLFRLANDDQAAGSEDPQRLLGERRSGERGQGNVHPGDPGARRHWQ